MYFIYTSNFTWNILILFLRHVFSAVRFHRLLREGRCDGAHSRQVFGDHANHFQYGHRSRTGVDHFPGEKANSGSIRYGRQWLVLIFITHTTCELVLIFVTHTHTQTVHQLGESGGRLPESIPGWPSGRRSFLRVSDKRVCQRDGRTRCRRSVLLFHTRELMSWSFSRISSVRVRSTILSCLLVRRIFSAHQHRCGANGWASCTRTRSSTYSVSR